MASSLDRRLIFPLTAHGHFYQCSPTYTYTVLYLSLVGAHMERQPRRQFLH